MAEEPNGLVPRRECQPGSFIRFIFRSKLAGYNIGVNYCETINLRQKKSIFFMSHKPNNTLTDLKLLFFTS